MIEVKDLTKKYGKRLAVDHLSFQIEKGKIYGFLGPNGAGKSTTMNMITGYLAPTEGTVLIDGKDVQKQPEEAKRHVGYLPELPPLYVDMTVEEYLSFAAELKKVPGKERKEQIAKIMEMVGITDVKGRLIKNLSKGYKQRVGLAQALLGNPDILILDEPSVGLDPKQIIEMRELIKKLGEEHTIILSSHILSEVSAVCDHVMIISHGKLVASDTPQGLKHLMEGSMEIELTVKGEEAKAKAVAAGLPKVDVTTTVETTPEGYTKLRITCKEKQDAREDLFYAFAKEELPILEMIHHEKSLEDVFLELTQSTEAKDGQGETEDQSVKAENAKEEKTVQEAEEQSNAGDL